MRTVSVIVPTYKRSKTLETTINSLLKQTYPGIEIIIVDDNGIENKEEQQATEAKVKILQQGNESIKYIALENNSGAAIARNVGIDLSTSDYISFLDDDDIYHPNKIEKQIEIFESIIDPNIAFIKCEMAYVYPNGQRKVSNKKKYFDGNQFINHIVDQHAIVGTPTFMFKRTALIDVDGFFNTPIRQEYMLILKLLAGGYTGFYHNDVLVDVITSLDGISVGKSEYKAKALYTIYNERVKYKKYVTDVQLEMMKIQFLNDMFRWYSTYNLPKAYGILNKLRPSLSKRLYFKYIITMLVKYYLGNGYYRLKYMVRA